MFLITRPQDKAKQTKHVFDRAGLPAFVCPAQKIVPLSPSVDRQKHYTFAIVTSTYAANWLVLQELYIDRIIAIGLATQRSILSHHAYRQTAVLLPQESNSEGVLKMPTMSSVEGQNILLVKGVDGRDLLESQLTRRKANVDIIETYRRQSNISDLLIRRVEELPIKCIIVTSTEIAALIISHLPRKWLLNKSWIAASERIANFLTAHNYSRITVSQGASDTAVLKAATQLDEKNGNTSG